MKQRIIHYDVLSGVMLLFMMHHHACGMCGLMEDQLHTIPYKLLYFYIAYFFFKAGCFYNPKKSLKQVLVDSSKRLLIPFFAFTFIGYVLFGATESVNTWHYWLHPLRQVFAIGRVEGNGPLWFLLSLFLVRLFFQTSGDTLWKQICWIIVGACIGIIGNYYGLRPRTISNVGMGVFFYGLGYLLRNIQYNKLVGSVSSILFVLVYVIMAFWGWHLVDFSFNKTELGLHPIWLLNSVIACVAINFLLHNYNWRFSSLAWIGRNSMVFLCTHALVYEFMHECIFTHIVVSPYLMLSCDWICMMLICGGCVFIFKNKYLSWMIGENKSC